MQTELRVLIIGSYSIKVSPAMKEISWLTLHFKTRSGSLLLFPPSTKKLNRRCKGENGIDTSQLAAVWCCGKQDTNAKVEKQGKMIMYPTELPSVVFGIKRQAKSLAVSSKYAILNSLTTFSCGEEKQRGSGRKHSHIMHWKTTQELGSRVIFEFVGIILDFEMQYQGGSFLYFRDAKIQFG